MFFTGDAGTGKSHILRVMIEALQEQLGKDKVFVTASTGIAACNIGGITIHSFAGLGITNMDVNQTLRKVRQNEAAVERWKACQVLIIDEISMLDGRLFDMLEYVGRTVRNDSTPFGGIQIVAAVGLMIQCNKQATSSSCRRGFGAARCDLQLRVAMVECGD